MPKQFTDYQRNPLFSYSIVSYNKWLYTSKGFLAIVSHKSYIEKINTYLSHRKQSLNTPPIVTEGGASRHQSTIAGIKALEPHLKNEDIILIHDAARPIIQECEFNRIIQCFSEGANIVSLAGPVHETMVISEDGFVKESIDRSCLSSIKTPQGVRVSQLSTLMRIPEKPYFTDLITWGREANIECMLANSEASNIKVTTESDLTLLQPYIQEFNQKQQTTSLASKNPGEPKAF